MKRPLDPRRVNIALDANALDRPLQLPERSELVNRVLALCDAGEIHFLIPHGVLTEILDGNVPHHVNSAFTEQIMTIPTNLTIEEQRIRDIIEVALQGNAKPGKHKADAQHLAEAAKYGGYFITHDERILKRSAGLAEVLPPSLSVVTLAQFLDICESYGITL